MTDEEEMKKTADDFPSNGNSLPEAPTSITIRGYYRGFSVLITRRPPTNDVELEKITKAIDNMVDKGFKASWADKVEPQTNGQTIKAPDCPKCGEPMVERTTKTTGAKFWGCSRYPECDGTIWPKKG